MPIKDPKAAFRADLELLLFMISPIKAPTKGPIITPKGIGAINPTTNPIVAPIIPALLPPKRLVPIAGMVRFKMYIRIAITSVIPNNQ